MTGNEMISTIAELLGRIGTALDAQILLQLKLAQRIAERGPTLPFFLHKEASGTLTIGEPKLAIAEDFLREVEPGDFGITAESKYRLLRKWDFDSLRSAYTGETPAVGDGYALKGAYFWIYPIPDQAYPYVYTYYARDSAIAADDNENLWSLNYPDLLMGLAGQKLCAIIRALEVKPVFDEMASLALKQLIADETAREVANLERSMNDDD